MGCHYICLHGVGIRKLSRNLGVANAATHIVVFWIGLSQYCSAPFGALQFCWVHERVSLRQASNSSSYIVASVSMDTRRLASTETICGCFHWLWADISSARTFAEPWLVRPMDHISERLLSNCRSFDLRPSVRMETWYFLSGLSLLALAFALWLNRQRDLGFQLALSAAVSCVVIQGQIYNMVLLLIPAVWVAEHVSQIQESGLMSQIALTIARVAFIVFWASSALGGVLMHSNSMARSVAWSLPENTVLPVLAALLGILLLQLFGQKPSDQDASPEKPAPSSSPD